ncbi:MAG TPA: S46 family peptidase [Verrucomicrobiae bacterium]|nr:S46 family peptidase [Verrucomicrobiae bacterium]
MKIQLRFHALCVFRFFRAVCVLCSVCVLLAPAIQADEGMWLFNNPPLKLLQEKYHFQPTASWLEHVQKSSVRFDNGGSGSFVSRDGLVMTNHHVGADCLGKISTKDKNYLATGFEAKSNADEPKCEDLELNVLMSIEDMTSRVAGAVQPGMDAASAERARRAEINSIEKESRDKTGLRSDVVTLYNGGQFHLYLYKQYTDVRLVFAPQKSVAFFGGDPDNFEYPRYDLDICFFRVYENNKPVHVDNYLKWSATGATEGELIFVSGHPGRTERGDTVAHTLYQRDYTVPGVLNLLRRREVLLDNYSERSAENARRAEDELFGIKNSRKAYLGILAGLQDPAILGKIRDSEKELRDAVAKDPKLSQSYGDGWDQVAATIKSVIKIRDEYNLFGIGPQRRAQSFNSDLFDIAIKLVRLAEETPKPNGERLREYSEAGLDSLKLQLFSDAPIYEDLETVQLADSLGMMAEVMGEENETVRMVLAGKSPRERAAELIHGTALKDVAVRKRLADGGLKAIQDSNDPMIQLARQIDPESRRIRQVFEQQVDEPQRQAYGKIANARFAVYGSSVYPDATFTLRLAFGEAKGYTEGGEKIPWATTLGGTYEHAAAHNNKDPFELPKIWNERKSQLTLSTPFNFVSTADIIGGNSGSPVINRQGELVGIIFDGNLQSLVLDYTYTDNEARAVAVHSAGILEALRKVYSANRLVTELTGKN